MKVTFIQNDQKGFSLVELMIVVAIIGILASLAVPRFQSFQAKAKASEAKANLSHAYTLEVAYHGDNDSYGTLQQIGFKIGADTATTNTLAAGTNRRYSYVSSGVTANAFVVTATATTGKLGGCQTGNHVVTVDQDKTIPNVAIPGC